MKNTLDKEVHNFILNEIGQNEIQGKKIAVGYSGGADSTALIHIMKRKATFFKFEIEAVFFTHLGSPLTEGEDKSLLTAKEFCKSNSIKLKSVNLILNQDNKQSWEDLGRRGRMDFYKKSDYDFVFLGHHLDDQNETTMTQLFRGGIKGVSGMTSKSNKICRPLLKVSKTEIYEYLKQNSLVWEEDPTNTNTDFTRNFWRKIGLPTIENHYPGYSRTLESFRLKMDNQQKINYDLAVIDGLEYLKNGQPINIKELDDYRIINLIQQYCLSKNVGYEDNKIKDILQKSKSTKEINFSIGEDNLTISKDLISIGMPTLVKKMKP